MTTRTYQSDALQVLWDSQRCIHVAHCIRALPGVFNPLARPWIRLDAADTDAIVAAVEQCPTGALRYLRSDGVPEAPADPTTIEVVTNGPLLLRGDLHVVAPDGATIARETRLALCRCGASENKPFCDNAHRRIGFRSNDAAPPIARNDALPTHDDRARAESPADLGPPQPATFAR